jgi:O-antigen/teichoic acid export membrane protein
VTGTRGEQRLLTRGTGVIALSVGLMNITTYAFTMLAARILGPAAYGAMAGLMATVLVIGVIQLGVQATAARRVAADPGQHVEIEHRVVAVTTWIALALGAALLVASPLLMVLLRLDGIGAAILVAVGAVPLTITGAQLGVLQGERRWGELSLLYVMVGVSRLVLGVGLLAWRPTEVMAMLSVTLGFFLTALLGLFILRGERERGPASDRHSGRAVVIESLQNGFALLAFFALSNVDVIIARNVLSAESAGLYAAGLIVTKAVLFLPQFVVIISFPTLSGGSGRRRALTLSLASVAVLGLLSTAAAYLAPSLVLFFVGGEAFDAIGPDLWLFALVGTALSVVQLLLFSELARQGRSATWFIWAALALLSVSAPFVVDTVEQMVLLVACIDGVLCLVLVAVALRSPESVGSSVPAAPGADGDVEGHGQLRG